MMPTIEDQTQTEDSPQRSYGAWRQHLWRESKRASGLVLVHGWTSADVAQQIEELVGPLGDRPNWSGHDLRQELPAKTAGAAKQRAWRERQRTDRVQIHRWVSPELASQIRALLKHA